MVSRRRWDTHCDEERDIICPSCHSKITDEKTISRLSYKSRPEVLEMVDVTYAKRRSLLCQSKKHLSISTVTACAVLAVLVKIVPETIYSCLHADARFYTALTHYA